MATRWPAGANGVDETCDTYLVTYPQQPYPPQPAPSGQPWPTGQGAPPYPTGAPQFGYSTPPAVGMPPPGYRYLPPRPVGPTGEPLAEFSDRFLARLIDGAILGAVGMVIAIPAFIVMFAVLSHSINSASDQPNMAPILVTIFGAYGAILVLALVAGYVYEVEMTRRTGQTVGKRVMKIRVVPLDTVPMSRSIVARRWLASTVAGVFIPMFSWIDGLWQLWDQPLRQCLHDKFARTVVVKCNPTGQA